MNQTLYAAIVQNFSTKKAEEVIKANGGYEATQKTTNFDVLLSRDSYKIRTEYGIFEEKW